MRSGGDIRPLIPRQWDRAAWWLIAAHAGLLAAWWPLLPLFVDVYYHLNVVAGFRDAGGIALHDFWELAPGGRPHLYPPAVHLALLSLDGLRLGPITLARLASLLPYPALLLTTWWFVREWFGSRLAYWATLCGLLPFSYLLVTTNTIAASWALVFWLVGLIALHRQAMCAFSLSGALAFYTHLGIPWLMVSSWALLACCAPSLRRTLARGAGWTILLASPWFWHVWVHRAVVGPIISTENQYLEIPVLLYGLAMTGAFIGLRRLRGAARCALFSVCIALLPLAIHYRFRFLSGQGLLAVSLLAGTALMTLHQALVARWSPHWRGAGVWVPVCLTVGLFATHPTLFLQRGGGFFTFWDSSLVNLTPWGRHELHFQARPFYYAHLMDPLVQLIRRHSEPDEIIGCNLPYTGGLLATLSHRAMATAMFPEVRSGMDASAALRNAHLLIWLKVPPNDQMPSVDVLKRVWGAQLVAETDMAHVLRNPQAGERRRVVPGVLPLWLGQLLLWMSLVAIWLDLRRRFLARLRSAGPAAAAPPLLGAGDH